MTAIVWDKVGERYYETGVKKGVLYPMKADGSGYDTGVAWNGLITGTESPSGAEANKLYADDIVYGTLRSAEEFGMTIEAYTYPDEFAPCDGNYEPTPGMKVGQQPRRSFAFAYVTSKGNDQTADAGYLLHIAYGCTAAPSERSYQTINDSPEAITMSWSVETVGVAVTGADKPSALITLDSSKIGSTKMKTIEDSLYGTNATDPTLLTPDDIQIILEVSGVTGQN